MFFFSKQEWNIDDTQIVIVSCLLIENPEMQRDNENSGIFRISCNIYLISIPYDCINLIFLNISKFVVHYYLDAKL